jgi:hypothetical protein
MTISFSASQQPAARAFAAAHPTIGIGGQIRPPFDAIMRELVVIRTILSGTI